jgi:hypothetical protein
VHHPGQELRIRCGRWRKCRGCALWKQWQLTRRFGAGIKGAPAGVGARFFTLTFPSDHAPDEDEAQKAWRSLVARLKYRELLGEYGWVLQRTKRGTLHFHGIAHMPWMQDGLSEWRRLIQAAGFGVQNRLETASPKHARYCSRYISSGLADVAPLRRAFGFSRGFPQAPAFERADPDAGLLASLGAVADDCYWVTTVELHRAFHA